MKKLLFLFLFISLAAHANAIWWDDDWGYQRQLIITAPADQNTYVYSKLSIVLDTNSLILNGKLQSDCDDLRVIRNGSESLDLDVKDCNASSTTIYFASQDRIVHGNSITNYSIYYGNSSASKYPNNRDKFNGMYDGFNDAIFDSNWVASGTWIEANGKITGDGKGIQYSRHGFEIPKDVNLIFQFIQTDGNSAPPASGQRLYWACFGDQVSSDINAMVTNGFCNAYNVDGIPITGIIFQNNQLVTGYGYPGTTNPGYYFGYVGTRASADPFVYGYNISNPPTEDLLYEYPNWDPFHFPENRVEDFNGFDFTGQIFYPILGNYTYPLGTLGRSGVWDGVIVNYQHNTTVMVGGETAYFNQPSSACVPVILNGEPSNKIDVVFVGSGFPDLNTFDWVVDDMIDYSGNGLGIMHYSPFLENRDKFNFWKVNTLQTFNGGGYIGPFHDQRYSFEADSLVEQHCGVVNERIPLKILLSVFPRFHPFATAFPKDNSTWGGAYITVGEEYLANCFFYDEDGYCAIDAVFVPYRKDPDQNINLGGRREAIQQVTVHEFGHAFSALADEYDAGSFDLLFNSGMAPNCDHVNTCSKWASITNDCMGVCGHSNWYKSYLGLSSDSLMNIPDSQAEFTLVSRKEIERDINSYFTESVYESSPEKSYRVNYAVKDGNFAKNSVELVGYINITPISFQTDYHVVLESEGGVVLYDSNIVMPNSVLFFPSRDWLDANGHQFYVPNVEPIEILTDFNADLIVPYEISGRFIKIFDVNGVVKLIIDVGEFGYDFDYALGSGGEKIQGANYNVRYSISNRPIGKLTSASYKVSLETPYISK